MTLEEHARLLGINPASTAAAWHFLRSHPLPEEADAMIGAVAPGDGSAVLDGLLTEYVQGLEELAAMPSVMAAPYIEDVRALGLLAIEAAGALLEAALVVQAEAWVRALDIVIEALIRSLNKLSAGAAAAFSAFWGVSPLTAGLVGLGVFLGVVGAAAVLATGPVGTVLVAGAAKGMSRGVRLI